MGWPVGSHCVGQVRVELKRTKPDRIVTPSLCSLGYTVLRNNPREDEGFLILYLDKKHHVLVP